MLPPMTEVLSAPIRRGRIGGRSLALIGAATILVATLNSAAGATVGSSSAFEGATLYVDSVGSADVTFDLELHPQLRTGGPPGVAARVDLMIPAGYRVNLTLRQGARVGELAGAVESAGGDPGSTYVDAPIVVDDPARYASDPAAQACAPGDHTALWRMSPKILGRPFEVPIAVDAVPQADGTAYMLHFCPLDRPSAAYPAGLALDSAMIDFARSVSAPAHAGTYRWSALVTPATPEALTPDPSATFELRAVAGLPQSLTLHARYEPRSHEAILSGLFVSGARPQAAARVRLTSMRVSGDDVGTSATVTTKADGTFSLRRRIAQTTIYSAYVADRVRSCADASTAPGGCTAETVAGSPTALTFLVLPRKTDPTLQTTPRDRDTARRSVPAPGDVAGAGMSGIPPIPCQGFAPDLHRLVAHGYASSPELVSADGRTTFSGTAWVFTGNDEAASYFRAVARAAAGRCEGGQAASAWDPRAKVAVRNLRLPRIGDESRAYRALVVSRASGTETVDVLFARVSRTVITLRVIEVGVQKNDLERFLLRVLVARAGQTS
jgi:hypothetical protein